MLHIDGLGGIVQSRGPWLLKSYAGKSIFLEHRITLVEDPPCEEILTHI